MIEMLSFTCEIEESCVCLEDRIAEVIKKSEHEFGPYFSRLIDTEDARYTVLNDSLVIENVSISGTAGFAYGKFAWNFYAGCKDIDSTDEREVELPFEISGNTLKFDIQLPIIWRSDGE